MFKTASSHRLSPHLRKLIVIRRIRLQGKYILCRLYSVNHTILIAVIFAPVRFTISPDVLYSEIVVPSAVASKSMVFDKFVEFVEEAFADIISFAIAVPSAYSCTERLPSVVLSPVTPQVMRYVPVGNTSALSVSAIVVVGVVTELASGIIAPDSTV